MHKEEERCGAIWGKIKYIYIYIYGQTHVGQYLNSAIKVQVWYKKFIVKMNYVFWKK